MFKLALPLIALVVAAPAIAETASTPLNFERDGIHYRGAVRTENGVTFITGKEIESGRAFDLKLVNGRVTGQFGADRVSYNAPTSRIR